MSKINNQDMENLIQLVGRKAKAKIEAIIIKASDQEAQRLGKWLASDVLGSDTVPPYQAWANTRWPNLTKGTRKRKFGNAYTAKNRFYSWSGDLKRYLATQLNPVMHWGGTEVISRKGTAKYSERLSYRPFPFADLSNKDDNYQGRGIPESEAVKIFPVTSPYHRALAGPAMAHFIKMRIPKVVNRALRDAGYKLKGG